MLNLDGGNLMLTWAKVKIKHMLKYFAEYRWSAELHPSDYSEVSVCSQSRNYHFTNKIRRYAYTWSMYGWVEFWWPANYNSCTLKLIKGWNTA